MTSPEPKLQKPAPVVRRPWPREVVAAWAEAVYGGGVGMPTGTLVALLGAHVVLVAAAKQLGLVSTAWALGALLVGLAALRRSRPDRLVIVAAYVTGAQLVWRGTGALVFYEYGKYVVILLLGLGLLRYRERWSLRWPPVIFALAMLPSLLVLPYFDRTEVAFNLSGPAALAVATLFFSDRPVGRALLVRLSEWAMAPIVGLAAISAFGTAEAGPSRIGVESKMSTAGIGPNQVSSVLALGLLLVVVCLLLGPPRRSYRVLMGGLGVWLAGQTLLSFSRGGFWTTVGALLVVAWYLVRTRRMRRNLVISAVVLGGLFQLVVFPVVDHYTAGRVSARFSDPSLSGRDLIMEADWDLFLEHPLLGVGPGQSYAAHAETYRAANAHTEYTRLLSEHGMFGVLAMLMLALMTWRRWRAPVPLTAKAWTMAFTAWALLYMFHSAMRLVAPAFLFGLGAATLVVDWPSPAWWYPASRLGAAGRRRLEGGPR